MTVVTVGTHVTVVTVVTVKTQKTFFTTKMFSPENIKKNFFHTKNHAISSHKKSRNLFTQKITEPLHTNNIARIAKRCPENITSVVKLLFQKVQKKYNFVYNSDNSDSSDSSDSMVSSEKNLATSQQKKYATSELKRRRRKKEKEQFDTFDNRCDVLRAAFCDSLNVLIQKLQIVGYTPICRSASPGLLIITQYEETLILYVSVADIQEL